MDVLRRGRWFLGNDLSSLCQREANALYHAVRHSRIFSERRSEAILASSAKPLSRPPPLRPSGSLKRLPRLDFRGSGSPYGS